MLSLVRSRLSVRLAGLFLCASLLPVLGVGWAALAQLGRAVHRGAERRQELVAVGAEGLLLEAVERAEEKLTTVARLLAGELAAPEVGVFSSDNFAYRETVVERLSALVEPAEVFLELQYFAGGPAGDGPQFVAQAQQLDLAAVQQRQPDFPLNNARVVDSNIAQPLVTEPVREGRPYRDERLTLHEGFPSLRLSQPVPEPGGTSGALVAYVDFAPLVANLARLAGEGSAIRVEDGVGTVLAEVGSVEGERLERAVAVGDTGWTITVAEPAAAVRAPLFALRARLWPWIGAAALAAVVASLVFSARITRPVARLQRAAEALEGGDLGARAGVARADEIGRLGAAFDRMAAALHALDAAKSEFIGNVSHELRTPLTSLRLSVANLLDGLKGELSAPQRETLARVRRELERLSTLVEDLLELARLEADGVRPERGRVDLAALGRECVELLAPAAEAKGVTLAVKGAGAATGDPKLLRRVLVNLLDNGIKFTPEGGAVRVRVADGRLAVADDGPGGVPPDAFERFRQGRHDGVKHAGAGLGLAIVARLVELSGGRVAVAPGEAGGSVFTVDLPAEGAP